MTIRKGDTVKIEYEGRFDGGEVFDSSNREGKQHPIEFEVGAHKVVKGFDEAVIGMKKGEKKEITIKPADGYGERNDKLVHEVPRDKLPQSEKLEAGMMLGMQTPDGQQIPAVITKVNEKSVTVDLNHPLAGKTLIFKIKVV